jgi:CubicO group peptidase (beta-lactamase class C family)
MRRRRILLLVSVLFVTAVGAPMGARTDPVDDFVAAQMQRYHVPGLSLVVVRKGAIVKSKGYGLANVALKTPATPQTVYKIGSVSKQFIATGIMLLVQSGRLAIDDPASKYLDDTPPSWQPITIRHLLTHTSGILREAPGFAPFKAQSDAEVIRTAYAQPLRFTPGTKWEYCNTGYFALAEIIRKVSGQPWTTFLAERVFKPSGMSTTWPTNTTARVEPRAVGYGGDDNGRNAPDWTALRPSGAFLSTVLDLAKWDRVLETDAVLTAASRRLMWTPVQLSDGSSYQYGFGWELGSVDGHPYTQHGGSMPGFRAGFARFADAQLTVIVLMNAEDVDRDAIVRGIATLYLSATQAPAAASGRP